MSDIIKMQVLKGVNLYYIPDKKYKTISMTAFLNRKLKREEAKNQTNQQDQQCCAETGHSFHV